VFLVVGLGNPGREHEGNRHNVGFMVADALHASFRFPPFREKFKGRFSRGEVALGPGTAGRLDVALLEPETFMNLSGESVQPAAAFLKIPPERVVIVHDELDLPWRDVRLKFGGGHAGHNGLRSLIQRLGTPDFVRVRVGIGRPPADFRGDVASYVLSGFDPFERADLPGVIEAACSATRRVILDGLAAAMKAVNTRG
jgi:PTH1 family peptidyl-tRNA hydrolase